MSEGRDPLIAVERPKVENTPAPGSSDHIKHRVQCAAFVNGCESTLLWKSKSKELNVELLELNGWKLDHGLWICGLHDKKS